MKIVLAIDSRQPLAGYQDALLSAGALPAEVEVVRPGEALPDDFDGLVISGGADIDPSRYGEVPLFDTVSPDVERDALDLELFTRAERLGAPVFGICRGMQILNVALGGTLWQDLPTQRPHGVEHLFSTRDGHDRARLAHAVHAVPLAPSALPLAATLAASDGAFVNSRHHQAVKDLAAGLVVLAVAPDGLVEAFARQAGPFLAAVQWHPENLAERADQKALFTEFLAAVRERASRRTVRGAVEFRHESTVNAPCVRSGGVPERDDNHDDTPHGERAGGELSSPAVHDPLEEPEPA